MGNHFVAYSEVCKEVKDCDSVRYWCNILQDFRKTWIRIFRLKSSQELISLLNNQRLCTSGYGGDWIRLNGGKDFFR